MTSCSDHKLIDIGIVGAGPAGLTAALYAARSGLNTVIFGDPYAGQLARAGTVENFIPLGSTTGLEIIEKMVDHATSSGAKLEEKKIKQIIKTPNKTFHIYDENGETYCVSAVVLCTGTQSKKLKVKGEMEYARKGVNYCTICDGPLYKDQPVVVTGFGDEAVLAAMRMVSIASTVALVSTKPRLGADPLLIEEFESNTNTTLYEFSKPLEIIGDGQEVIAFKFKHNENERTEEVKGVFVEVGVLPSSAIASGVGVELNGQFVKVDDDQATNVPGFFAAGDIAGSKMRQAIISAGDGARAALSAIDYIKKNGLSSIKLKTTQWGGTGSKVKEREKKEEQPVESNGSAMMQYIQKDEGFIKSYERYNVDAELVAKVRELLPKAKVVTVSAHWCPDCRRNVPRFTKIGEKLPGWTFVVEDRDKEGVREKYGVRKIPSFIIYDEQDNEIGRIIEHPKYKNIEEDLLKIAEKSY